MPSRWGQKEEVSTNVIQSGTSSVPFFKENQSTKVDLATTKEFPKNSEMKTSIIQL